MNVIESDMVHRIWKVANPNMEVVELAVVSGLVAFC